MQLTGLLSFPLTAFDRAGRVDLAAVAEHVAHQLAARPGALFVACGTGEFPALSLAEYREVVATATSVVAGAVPVLSGVGGGPAVAREFLTAAGEAGVDGVLLLPPYLVQGPQQGLTDHVRHVVGGSGVPTVVYRRGTARYGADAARQLLDVPEVVGLKDGTGDVEEVLGVVRAVRGSGHPRAAGFLFLDGTPTAEVSARAFRAIGVESYSSAVHCFAPQLAGAFHRALGDGRDADVDLLLDRFFLPLARLRDEVPGYAVSLVKAAARLTGQQVGSVRPPLVDPRPEHLARLAELLTAGEQALGELTG